MTASSSTSTSTSSSSETSSGSSDSGVDIQANSPSADKAEILNENEAAAPSCQLSCEGRADSPTQRQVKKISHVRSLYKDYVYVDVGPSKQRFGVHKGLICHRSKFFDAAFNGSFSEASKGIVTLTEEYPDLFDIVHTWLYTDQLTQSKDGRDVRCSLGQLTHIFVLADKLDMPMLCNNAIDALKSLFLRKESIPEARAIIETYAITPENSVLRKLLVAIITFAPKYWRSLALEYRKEFVKCPDFLFDLSMALQNQNTHRPASIKDAPFLKDPCSFHQHAEGEKDCSGTVVPRSGKLRSNESHAPVLGSILSRVSKMNSES